MSATTQTKQEAMRPVTKQLVVEAPQERAFRVFTENFDAWWPREHHIGAAALKAAVLEPKKGGRWYEICEDGSECQWGKMLEWDPPRRLLLAWQLNGEWKYDPELITEIEVTFTPEGPKRTRVDFEHRYIERMGALAEATRKSLDGGWGGILDLYRRVAEG